MRLSGRGGTVLPLFHGRIPTAFLPAFLAEMCNLRAPMFGFTFFFVTFAFE